MIELVPPSSLKAQLNAAFSFAQQQVHALTERNPDFYPLYTRAGKWKHTGEAWTHWCDGFLPGMMWIFFERTRDEQWSRLAERYSRPLEPRRFDRAVHDLGFLFMSSYYRWFQLTGDKALEHMVIDAGRTQSLRFQAKGEYLCSFLGPESLFIDIMMNTGVVFYAAERLGDKAIHDVALRHSLTSRRVLVRGDGSTAHEGIFDTATGEFLRQTTRQGKRGDTCWSRGLAWALYGFGTVYRHTRDPRFLATAEACAGFYIQHTPGDGVPPWDYDLVPGDPQHLDTSAAAIAASGLFQLSEISNDPARAVLYRNTAFRILDALTRPPHLASATPGWEGILTGGVYHIHKNLGVDESVMWGEYFFVEALAKSLCYSQPREQG